MCIRDSKSVAGNVSCVGCPVGQTSFPAAVSVADCLCVEGYYVNNDVCVKCPLNEYKSFIGNRSECLQCPSNTVTINEGSTEFTHCVCNVGHSGSPGGPCTACSHNYYQNNIGSATCLSCGDSNLVTLDSASTEAADCVCKNGFFMHMDLSSLEIEWSYNCLLYTSPSPRDRTRSRMPSSA